MGNFGNCLRIGLYWRNLVGRIARQLSLAVVFGGGATVSGRIRKEGNRNQQFCARAGLQRAAARSRRVILLSRPIRRAASDGSCRVDAPR